MARRALLLLALTLLLGGAAPALAGDGLGQQKAALDAKLAAVQATIARTQARESQLSGQIGVLTSSIHGLELRVGGVSSKLSALQADLALHQRRLDKLNELFTLQTLRFRALRAEYALAVQRLDERLVSIYKQGEPSTADVLLAASTIQDVLDEFNYLGLIARNDKRIAHEVGAAKHQVKVARARTARVRQGVVQEQRVIGARVQQQAILRQSLLLSRGRLAAARAGKLQDLASARQQATAALKESQALQAASAEIEARLRAASRSSTDAGGSPGTTAPGTTTPGATSAPAAPSAAGFIWPVQGPITSPFGPRWGSFHPGVDIGVPSGTPVHAAAAGTVIWCGWMSGYGNLVMIDHHNGLATLYGHNTSVAVSCGEQVAQGQVVSYSGCTGYCTGPHVHFEVRLNGSPVDPLGYLP